MAGSEGNDPPGSPEDRRYPEIRLAEPWNDGPLAYHQWLAGVFGPVEPDELPPRLRGDVMAGIAAYQRHAASEFWPDGIDRSGLFY
jgi:hypothetical protein